MAAFLHRTTREYRPSAHTADPQYDANWIMNPDLSPLGGLSPYYAKGVGQAAGDVIVGDVLVAWDAGEIAADVIARKTAQGYITYNGTQYLFTGTELAQLIGLKTEAGLSFPRTVNTTDGQTIDIADAGALDTLAKTAMKLISGGSVNVADYQEFADAGTVDANLIRAYLRTTRAAGIQDSSGTITSWVDATGNADGTVNAGREPTLVADPLSDSTGPAARSTTASTTNGINVQYTGSGDYSIQATYRFSALVGFTNIFGAVGLNWGLYLNGDVWTLEDGGNTDSAFTAAAQTGIDYHVVLTKDVNNYYVYINGVLVHTSTFAPSVSPQLFVGGYSGTGAGYAGDLFCAAVYNETLSQTQIDALYVASQNQVEGFQNFNDDFETGSSLNGKWVKLNGGTLGGITLSNGRYRALLDDNTADKTLFYHTDEGEGDYLLLSLADGESIDVVAENCGIGTPADSQAHHAISGDAYNFCGLQVHTNPLVPATYDSMHIVVGHRGTGRENTIESKSTVNGVSVVADIGNQALGASLSRADLRITISRTGSSYTCNWYYRQPGAANWSSAQAFPGAAPAFSDKVFVGLITYASGANGLPFVGTCDKIRLGP